MRSSTKMQETFESQAASGSVNAKVLAATVRELRCASLAESGTLTNQRSRLTMLDEMQSRVGMALIDAMEEATNRRSDEARRR